jgi:hypothetical protein
MKYIVQLIASIGLMFFISGCTSSAQSKLDGLNGNGCNNPKCKCPKPCQCGPSCRCGMHGNSDNMNGK